MLMLTGVVVVEPLGGHAASLAYMMKTQRRNQTFISGGGCFFLPLPSFFFISVSLHFHLLEV